MKNKKTMIITTILLLSILGSFLLPIVKGTETITYNEIMFLIMGLSFGLIVGLVVVSIVIILNKRKSKF
jgi:lipid-binding SYLF domain-containing protein